MASYTRRCCGVIADSETSGMRAMDVLRRVERRYARCRAEGKAATWIGSSCVTIMMLGTSGQEGQRR